MLLLTAYDVTRRETFESLDDIWMRDVDMYSTVEDSVKMVVANKCDKVTVWYAATAHSIMPLVCMRAFSCNLLL